MWERIAALAELAQVTEDVVEKIKGQDLSLKDAMDIALRLNMDLNDLTGIKSEVRGHGNNSKGCVIVVNSPHTRIYEKQPSAPRRSAPKKRDIAEN